MVSHVRSLFALALVAIFLPFATETGRAGDIAYNFFDSIPNTIFHRVVAAPNGGALALTYTPVEDSELYVLTARRYSGGGELLWSTDIESERSVSVSDVRWTTEGWGIVGSIIEDSQFSGIWTTFLDDNGELASQVFMSYLSPGLLAMNGNGDVMITSQTFNGIYVGTFEPDLTRIKGKDFVLQDEFIMPLEVASTPAGNWIVSGYKFLGQNQAITFYWSFDADGDSLQYNLYDGIPSGDGQIVRTLPDGSLASALVMISQEQTVIGSTVLLLDDRGGMKGFIDYAHPEDGTLHPISIDENGTVDLLWKTFESTEYLRIDKNENVIATSRLIMPGEDDWGLENWDMALNGTELYLLNYSDASSWIARYPLKLSSAPGSIFDADFLDLSMIGDRMFAE